MPMRSAAGSKAVTVDLPDHGYIPHEVLIEPNQKLPRIG